MKFDYSKSLKLRALIRRYEYERDTAVANLQVFFENSAGIGEHGNIIDEMHHQVKKLEQAEGRLKVLISYFANVPQPTPVAEEETTNDS